MSLLSDTQKSGSVENYKRTPQREDSLLLYIETCAVDAAGQLDRRKVNEAEISWLEEWDAQGFIIFSTGAMTVQLSNGAWENAHALRRRRAEPRVP